LEEKVKGIVIGSADFKESDRLITLFTLEKGILNAILKGVKKPNSKLKFAKEIFCFGEFILTQKAGVKNGFYIIIGCDLVDNFFDLSQNFDKYFEGCKLLEIIKFVSKIGQQDVGLFIELLKALKTLTYENVARNLILCKFLLKIFEATGYKLNLNKCASCGSEFFGKRYFCMETGEICCVGCKTYNFLEILPQTHTNFRLISNTPYEKLSTLKLSIGECLDLLVLNFKIRFNNKFSITL
jgi:DNA repair protein RecO (recombination protein O)